MAALVVAALSCALATIGSGLLGSLSSASAAAKNCTQNCVILVEVNGLEPKDITRANTPFLWALAHSGDGQNDPEYGAYPALSGRNGWAWQAARGVMSTGDGPATASLLTGDTAEQSGIPADLFAVPQPDGPGGQTSLKYYTTGGSISGATCGATDPCDPVDQQLLAGQTVLSQAQSGGKNVGAWVGDPSVCTIVNSSLATGSGLTYDKAPGSSSGTMEDVLATANSNSETPQAACSPLWASGAPSSYQGQSQYCPAPVDWPNVGGTQYYPAACPATDSEVLLTAANDLTSGSGYPDLSFLDLADVGEAKQRAGDSDCLAALGCGVQGSSGSAPQTEPQSVSRALHSTDVALAAFASDLVSNQNTSGSWPGTYMMVVGSHGYETTPTALRVPDPNAVGNTPPQSSCSQDLGTPQTGPGDLSCYVAEKAGSTGNQPNAVLVPQGTMATIYYTGPLDPQQEETTLNKLYTGLCGQPQSGSSDCSTSSDVNTACRTLFASAVPSNPAADPNCIQSVYYSDPTAIPATDAGSYGLKQFLFGTPSDPGYATPANPDYDANPNCQSSDPGGSFYDSSGHCDANLKSFYQQQQGSWHLNTLNATTATPDPSNPQNTTTVYTPTGAGGQLVVVLKPGWAGGPFVGVNTGGAAGPGGVTLPAVPAGTPTDPVDPYLGSSGGPRDRAVAAIINGPSGGGDPVIQYPDGTLGGSSDGLAPVTSYDPATDPPNGQHSPYVCGKSFMSANAKYSDTTTSASFAVDLANSDPGNDSAAFGSPVFNSQSDSYAPTGFECQAQTIDFAPTIEALQSISATSGPGQEADARFLDEAFARCLGTNATESSGPACGNVQDLGNAIPPPPVKIEPIIIPARKVIIIPPAKPKPYGFHGLIRNVQAQVVDQANNTVPFARPGTSLSSIRVTADFGKRNSEVTITLYRAAAAAARAPAARPRTALKAIVRFCPFTVQRDPNVQLRFEVPSAYQPDHVGLAVRQVRTLKSATGPGCGQAKHNAFVAYGPLKGAIVPILDAPLLHHFKPCPASLTVALPHGSGVTARKVEIANRKGMIRVLQGSQLVGDKLVIPASQLPGGPMLIGVQWLEGGQRKTQTKSYVSGFYNCTVAQRHRLGVR